MKNIQFCFIEDIVQWWPMGISEQSLGVLEKFQRSSALPKIKYNCVELFWSQSQIWLQRSP